MDVAYLAVTVVAALVNGYAAVLNFTGAESVRVVADRVRVPQTFMIPFGTLLAAGALGLLVGIAVPVIGLAAAIGLTAYFLCALSAHLRVGDRGVGGALTFLTLATAALATNLLRGS